MRIGWVIYGALDARSGGYLYDKQIVEGLVRRGHHVELISLPWANYARRLLQNASPHVRTALTRSRVDLLVQDELNHPSLFLANRYVRQQGGPPIVTLVHHLRSDEDHPLLARRFYRRIEQAYLRSVDAAICNSRTTRARAARLLDGPLPSCIAYPAGDHISPPAAAPIVHRKQALAHTQPELRLLFVGNLIPRKGLHHVIAALAALRHQWRLTIAGSLDIDRRYVARVRGQVARLELGDRVHFLDRVSDAALADLYATHHVLVLPSFEGYGIAYLEALAHAMPCIASSTGAAHEIITDGLNGFLVQTNNVASLTARLEHFAANRAALADMSAAARARYDEHPTWADATNVIEHFLTGLLGL